MKLYLKTRPRNRWPSEQSELVAVATNPAESRRRRERATILLAYASGKTYEVIAQELGITRSKVKNTLERARKRGAMASLDDRPRAGRRRVIGDEARAWIVSLAMQSPREHGYDRDSWTLDLLSQHGREHGAAAGHPCLNTLSRNTVVAIIRQAREAEEAAGRRHGGDATLTEETSSGT